MSSTVTTVVSNVITNPVYTAAFGLFVALALVGMLAAAEVGSGTRLASVQRLVRSSSMATVPLMIAFAAIAVVRVAEVLRG